MNSEQCHRWLNSLRNWVEEWLVRVCHLPWVDHEQVVPEWDRWVQKKNETTGAPEFRTVHIADGPGRVWRP